MVGSRPGGDGVPDAVGGEPVREDQLHAGVQAVQQPADQAEHVHDRGEQHDPVAAPGYSASLLYRSSSKIRSAAVRAMTLDGPVDPELSWISAVRGGGGPPAGLCGGLASTFA